MLSLLDFEGRRLRGARPFAVFQARGDRWTWRDTDRDFPFHDGRGDVLNELQRALNWAREDQRRTGTHGGAIGFFAYDMARSLEPRAFVASFPADDSRVPDARLVFYRDLIEEDIAPLDEQAENIWAAHMSTHAAHDAALVEDETEKADYLASVARIQNLIAAGDIYQANLTRRFERAMPCSPATLYNRLQNHAMPFSAFLQWDDWALVSNSPERFLRLENGVLTAQPIKGTIRRGAHAEEDALLKKQLAASAKDRAENVMIVDLMRNDLGRVCEYGSVRVPHLCEVRSFPTLHHLVSTVEGRLRARLDGVDAIRACFPCGSITGAPKIRAMQIIDELEPVPRRASMGAIGYFGFNGDMDWNVAIRTVTCRGQRAHFHVGGGIVADSIAWEEEAETRLKARGIEMALEKRASDPCVRERDAKVLGAKRGFGRRA